ncbi:MAG: copper resistance protein B [Moritella sp.]|nr:copper resistance protein B [Moritella sp.]NRA19126.1 copper resistance protein B [Oceanospirillaceae bacterium]NRB42104.1 copper resistance protein B [Pseudomonadales bacterium]
MIDLPKKWLTSGLFSIALIFTSHGVLAGAKDDPLLFMLNIDKFEVRDGDDDSYALEADAWLGYDLNKLRLKVEVERVKGTNENAELQLLYSRAIAPFWDLQLGVRHDIDPQPEQSWAVLGVQGISPYFFDIDAALFIGKSGRSAFRFEAEYEQMLTQRLVLIPEIELNFHGQTDLSRNIGSGLASSELSLRLVYQVRREFSPYVGVTWEAKHGRSKRIAESNGEETDNVQFVVGFQAWF